MTNKTIIKWISFTEWMPCSVCSTSSGDLLVILNSNSNMQTKAVRFFGSKEKQVIQFNEVGQFLFSSGYSIRYLRENMNLDICVSDFKGRSVVVVNKTGETTFYLHLSTLNFEGFIRSKWHHHRQPKLVPYNRLHFSPCSHPGSGRRVSSIHCQL